MMKKFLHIFIQWLPLGSTIVIVTSFVYTAVQQNYRQSLNDPQIQMTEDGVSALLSGKVPADIVPRGELFDIGKSLKPFIAVYDVNGKSLESSGYLDNKPPQPPLGVFDYAKKYGEDRVTWQPNQSTRIALVIRSVGNSGGYFVASGRNMREIELRVNNLTTLFVLSLFLALLISFVLYVLRELMPL